MDIFDPLTKINGIGDKTAGLFKKINIYNVYDLLTHIPLRYEDRTQRITLNTISDGISASITGTVISHTQVKTKTDKSMQIIAIREDNTGLSISLIWFNQKYIIQSYKKNEKIGIWGKITKFKSQWSIISPEVEKISDTKKQDRTFGIIPIYPKTKGLTSKLIQNKIQEVLNQIPQEILDIVPANLPSWKEAITHIHFPHSSDIDSIYIQRLKYDELLQLICKNRIQNKDLKVSSNAHHIKSSPKDLTDFQSLLKFELTNSQKEIMNEIAIDLDSQNPTNRLIQGDVGSGKTVIAAFAAYLCAKNNLSSAIMCPTQILAQQHFQTFNSIFNKTDISIGLATSTSKQNLDSHILIGTHSLLSEKIKTKNLGLVVVDEQHKFGVNQRFDLHQKGSQSVHAISMTATPIPRTLALTLFGNLNISIVRELPKDKAITKTWIVPEHKRPDSYTWIENQIKSHSTQCFWVCPHIENDPEDQTKSTTEMSNELKRVFKNLMVNQIHGQMKQSQKDKIMQDFYDKKIDILVCTPIVEVGIDNPNATIAVIENANQYGLSQLHQIRGRVGRGHMESFCLLFGPKNQRLEVLSKETNGLAIANMDLKIRGAGELSGTRQHGFFGLKIADIFDTEIISLAETHAKSFLKNPANYPLLLNIISKDKIDHQI